MALEGEVGLGRAKLPHLYSKMGHFKEYSIAIFSFATHLYGSVEGGTDKLVVVFGVEYDHHDVMGMSLKHLRTLPLLFPVPELDQHVI